MRAAILHGHADIMAALEKDRLLYQSTHTVWSPLAAANQTKVQEMQPLAHSEALVVEMPTGLADASAATAC